MALRWVQSCRLRHGVKARQRSRSRTVSESGCGVVFRVKGRDLASESVPTRGRRCAPEEARRLKRQGGASAVRPAVGPGSVERHRHGGLVAEGQGPVERVPVGQAERREQRAEVLPEVLRPLLARQRRLEQRAARLLQLVDAMPGSCFASKFRVAVGQERFQQQPSLALFPTMTMPFSWLAASTSLPRLLSISALSSAIAAACDPNNGVGRAHSPTKKTGDHTSVGQFPVPARCAAATAGRTTVEDLLSRVREAAAGSIGRCPDSSPIAFCMSMLLYAYTNTARGAMQDERGNRWRGPRCAAAAADGKPPSQEIVHTLALSHSIYLERARVSIPDTPQADLAALVEPALPCTKRAAFLDIDTAFILSAMRAAPCLNKQGRDRRIRWMPSLPPLHSDSDPLGRTAGAGTSAGAGVLGEARHRADPGPAGGHVRRSDLLMAEAGRPKAANGECLIVPEVREYVK